MDRHQPDPGHPQVGRGIGIAIVQIIQLLDDPVDIADPIPIAIVEGIISFWLVHFLQKVKP